MFALMWSREWSKKQIDLASPRLPSHIAQRCQFTQMRTLRVQPGTGADKSQGKHTLGVSCASTREAPARRGACVKLVESWMYDKLPTVWRYLCVVLLCHLSIISLTFWIERFFFPITSALSLFLLKEDAPAYFNWWVTVDSQVSVIPMATSWGAGTLWFSGVVTLLEPTWCAAQQRLELTGSPKLWGQTTTCTHMNQEKYQLPSTVKIFIW